MRRPTALALVALFAASCGGEELAGDECILVSQYADVVFLYPQPEDEGIVYCPTGEIRENGP